MSLSSEGAINGGCSGVYFSYPVLAADGIRRITWSGDHLECALWTGLRLGLHWASL